ncbi:MULTISPECIES: SpoIIE family protein phosphatase [unclassified Streptomyces]|uniref:SpoIIE family protein phosphatase n=1 Tax=unclassified Streptomyces TaxID=2593676 RepID=UPI003677B197
MEDPPLTHGPVHDGLPFTDGAAGALLDSAGRIVGWTAAAERLLALSAAEVWGRPVRELLADPSAWPALRARGATDAWSGETAVRTGEGRALRVGFQVSPLAGPDPGAAGFERHPAPATSSGAGTGPGTTPGAASGTGAAPGGSGDAPPGAGRGPGPRPQAVADGPPRPSVTEPARYFVLAAPATAVDRWRQDQAFTRELFLQDRVGLAVFDEGLRLVRTNTHLLPYTGLPADMRDRRLGDFLWPEDAAAIERRLREVLRTGRPLVRAEETARTLVDPGAGAVMAITAFRMQDPSGRVLGVTALFTDVTELRRSSGRLAVLHRATAAVGGSLSVGGTSEELAGVLVPDVADLAVVEIAEAVFAGEDPSTGPAVRAVLRRAAVAGRPGPDLPVPDLPVPDPTAVEVETPGGSGDGARSVTGTRPSPAYTMSAPLRARGVVLGRVTVHRRSGAPPYEPADLDLLREIAIHAGLALDNARRYTREHRAAVELQRSLLPPSQSETVAVSTAGVYLPADTGTGVGGDWFDVIPLSSARVALVVGDVVGHGLTATATMGRLRTAVRTLADLDLEPDELLVHLDDLVSQLRVETAAPDRVDRYDDGAAGEGGRPDDGRSAPAGESGGGRGSGRPGDPGPAIGAGPGPLGATCLYAVYDPVSRRCTLASAGHPPPAVRAPDGTVAYVPLEPGPSLGTGGVPFETAEVVLERGSVLALFTDGLVTGDGEGLDAGLARLRDHLADAHVTDETPLRALGHALVSRRPGQPLTDDVTLLLARTHAVSPENTATWPVEPDPAAVAEIRERATRQLTAWGLDELAFTTELVVSELVTNAIRYTGGPVEVRMIRAGRLTCEVSDPSATHPRMRRARLTDEGGRGLYLVAQLSARWGSRYTASGKTIWSEQDIPGEPAAPGPVPSGGSSVIPPAAL